MAIDALPQREAQAGDRLVHRVRGPVLFLRVVGERESGGVANGEERTIAALHSGETVLESGVALLGLAVEFGTTLRDAMQGSLAELDPIAADAVAATGEGLEVGHAEGPGPETGSRFKVTPALTEEEVGLLQDVEELLIVQLCDYSQGQFATDRAATHGSY